MHGKGGVHGGGACMAGGMVGWGIHGRGHAWWGGMHGRGAGMVGGHACQRGVHSKWACVAREACVTRGLHGRGTCVVQGMRGKRDGHCSGQFASYWNAFLLTLGVYSKPIYLFLSRYIFLHFLPLSCKLSVSTTDISPSGPLPSS